MEEISHTPPEHLTPEQRSAEVAVYLARGLVRLRMGPSAMSRQVDAESIFDLPSSATRAFMATRQQRKGKPT